MSSIMLLALCAASILVVKSQQSSPTVCHKECSDVWSGDELIQHTSFNMFVNRSGNQFLHRFNWKWRSHSGLWDVFFTDLPTKGVKTGGFYYTKHIGAQVASVHWKYAKKTLIWESRNKNVHKEKWNLTTCVANLPVSFSSDGATWVYQLGSLVIDGRASGGSYVDDRLFNPMTTRTVARSSRAKRETEDLEDGKRTVWNKIQVWFKELFDKGPEDARGWMTRIADWLLGLMERILS